MTFRAVERVALKAKLSEASDQMQIKELLENSNGDIDLIIASIFSNCDVTVNFHPDKFSGNGKLIIDNLLSDGMYHNQFITGTSNGGLKKITWTALLHDLEVAFSH